MAMANGKVLAGVAGGVFAAVAGVLGYFLYDAYSVRVEKEEELESQSGAFRQFHNAKVFASEKTIAMTVSNRNEYASWFGAAKPFVARGTAAVPKDESAPGFKQRLTQEVRRLCALPGGVEGRIAQPGFMFGFERYLAADKGEMPKKADVPRLAAQLAAISHFADTISAAGAVEIKDVKRVELPSPEEEEENNRDRRRNRRGGKDAKDAAASEWTSLEYAVTFSTRPAAFVKILNAFAADPQFIVVKSISFRESSDMILERITAVESANDKKNQPAMSARRRRAAMAAAEAENAEPKKENRLVVDPELDAPVTVNLALEVYAFDIPADDAEATSAEKGKEAAK